MNTLTRLASLHGSVDGNLVTLEKYFESNPVHELTRFYFNGEELIQLKKTKPGTGVVAELRENITDYNKMAEALSVEAYNVLKAANHNLRENTIRLQDQVKDLEISIEPLRRRNIELVATVARLNAKGGPNVSHEKAMSAALTELNEARQEIVALKSILSQKDDSGSGSGSGYGPWGLGVSALAGAGVGGLTGYLASRSSQSRQGQAAPRPRSKPKSKSKPRPRPKAVAKSKACGPGRGRDGRKRARRI